MLTYYLTQTARLLQNPSAPTSLYSQQDLTSYINTMRGQLAAESACIRRSGTINTVVGQREYQFNGITITDTSVAATLNVRRIQYTVGSGFKWVTPRPWEWFELYNLNNPVPASGAPKEWAQYGQGSAGTGTITNEGAGTISTGTFWLDPLPDISYVLTLDCACYPIALAQDTDTEAIPYQWTDAIPFGAAWMALLAAQTSARMAEAEKYLGYFKMYVQHARDGSNPDVLKYQYERQQNITLPNQVGISPPSGGGTQ